MTDPSDLSPQHEAVRHLLAEARHDEPVPDEVVARLDASLAGLTADRRAAAAPVIDLAARRRRLASFGVLAAAAVVVAGVAIGQIVPQGSDDSRSSADSGSSSLDGSADNGAAPDDAETLTEARVQKSSAPQAVTLPEVSLAGDLDATLTDLRSTSRFGALSAGDALVSCEVGVLARGRQVLAQVDGQPGLVLFRTPQGERQRAEVYVCGKADPVRRLWLPAP